MNGEEAKRLLEVLETIVKRRAPRRRAAASRIEVLVVNLHLDALESTPGKEPDDFEGERRGRPAQVLDGTDAPPAKAGDLRAMLREVVWALARSEAGSRTGKKKNP
jgi:hypothetical protein